MYYAYEIVDQATFLEVLGYSLWAPNEFLNSLPAFVIHNEVWMWQRCCQQNEYNSKKTGNPAKITDTALYMVEHKTNLQVYTSSRRGTTFLEKTHGTKYHTRIDNNKTKILQPPLRIPLHGSCTVQRRPWYIAWLPYCQKKTRHVQSTRWSYHGTLASVISIVIYKHFIRKCDIVSFTF